MAMDITVIVINEFDCIMRLKKPERITESQTIRIREQT